MEAAQVKTVEFNLANGKTFENSLTEVDLKSIKKYMLGSIRDMKLLLDDPGTNRTSEERFDFTSNEKECERCNFKKVCPRWEQED